MSLERAVPQIPSDSQTGDFLPASPPFNSIAVWDNIILLARTIERLSILTEKLSCHSHKFIGVYRLQNHFLWFPIEQELHIGGEGQQVSITPNVVVSKLDEMLYTLFLRVFSNGRDSMSFHLYWNAPIQ